MMLFPKVYNPKDVEEKWYKFWESKGYFEADPFSKKTPFCMVIPPPNVTGSLHMGHALNNTLQDILARYKRMTGHNVLWVPGTDHAGIATQNVVEKRLLAEGISREALGREMFIKRIWKWKEEFGGEIINQLKKLGTSCDWSVERFTMDEGLSRAVREVFVRLYKEGLIYRGDYLINWCPRCSTALSDLEVDHEEVRGKLYHLVYPLMDGKGRIVVVTTRPETMLGDTAVAVHPNDHRYRKFKGQRVILPIMERPIPIICDSFVDMDYGSGAVKVTPAHDFNDFEMAIRHKLEMIKILDEKGRMNENAGRYNGLDRFECREKLVEDLTREGLVEKIEDYMHHVGHCYRCKIIVEPMLSTQWFIKIKPLALPALEAVEKGKTRIIPKTWENTYFEWMKNIKDWCISRQIWWGHQIPAWYCHRCRGITVETEVPIQCSHCGSHKIYQETDVLDTWFSSALWPFSTLGWPENTPYLKTFYPTDTLVTGFDILFFWVARMLMMGLKFMNDVPFRDVCIHALVRDLQGKKMSKSRGNVIDPLDIIEEFGTDAFRYTLAALAAQGRDIKLAPERIEGYRNFMNKIWNASRFSLMNLEEMEAGIEPLTHELSLADKWIIARLNKTIEKVRASLDGYEFDEAAKSLYHFVWHEFCDWYLELIKPILYQIDNPRAKKITQKVLLDVLGSILRLLHPFIPFITEEIWQSLPLKGDSIMIAPYPEIDKGEFFREEEEMELVKEIITVIRSLKGEMGIHPTEKMKVTLIPKDIPTSLIIETHRGYIENLAKLSMLIVSYSEEKPKMTAKGVADGVEVFLHLEGLIDLEEEEPRLLKEIKKVDKELEIMAAKFSKEDFVIKAPEEIVEKETKRRESLLEKKAKLEDGLNRIREIKSQIPNPESQ